jgi:K+-transporting ATPase ATPase C chain
MKPKTIIIISEDGDSRERLEFPVTNRAQADEIVREIFPERNVNPERLNGDYPLWTWFIPNPLPSPCSPKASTTSPVMKTSFESLRVLAALTLLTGVLYPLAVTAVARIAFHDSARGSIVMRNGEAIGSKLIAQKTESPKYFWPRPSAADYATVPSGASNKGPTSADLAKSIAERRDKFGKDAPDELLTASGSGLDPHLSPATAKYQAPRVAAERKIPVETINSLIDELTESPQFGFLGEPRVNVLALNQALDRLK